ncbi:MAG: tetratricopeptide repeat protein [Acidobacteria bacterium]|nr:tetratricopeptide repeat protein [Acidobacteriota bacterium]
MTLLRSLLLAGAFAAVGAAACPPAAGCYEQGVAAFVKEDYKASGQAFEKAVAAEPENPDFHLWLGRAWGRRAERATGFAKLGALSLARQVRDEFLRAIELDPKHLGALQSLFDYYLNAPGIVGGGDDKAEALIDDIAAVDPARGLRARAALLEKQGAADEAEKALREAVRLEPNELDHQLSLAGFLARQGRFEESDRFFVAAAEQAPDSPAVWYARAKALIRSKRGAAEARRLLERYLKTPLAEPDAEPYSNARSLLDEL